MGSQCPTLAELLQTGLSMAFHGPSYGLSRECAMKSQAKFSPERAKQCVTWVEEVTGNKLGEMKDQIDFGELLKDGSVLCSLINALQPGSVKKINTLKAPFKQREKLQRGHSEGGPVHDRAAVRDQQGGQPGRDDALRGRQADQTRGAP